VQVVGYLQSITGNADVDLVTVSAYQVAGSQVLVLQRVDPGRRSREMSEAKVAARQAGVLYRGSASSPTCLRLSESRWCAWPTGLTRANSRGW
jgi:hypothetical protein